MDPWSHPPISPSFRLGFAGDARIDTIGREDEC